MPNWLVKLAKFCSKYWQTAVLVGLIIVWPWNLFLKFETLTAYQHGLLVDYLLPKIFVSDILMIAIFTLGVKAWSQSLLVKKLAPWWVILLIIQFFSSLPVVGLLTVLRLGLFAATGLTIIEWGKQHKLHFPAIRLALVWTVVSQLGIGMLQFSLGHSVFPSYLWFGETRLSSYAGIAHSSYGGAERVLAYGTTSHPNVWGGVIVICSWLLLIGSSKTFRLKSNFVALLVAVEALSLSLSAGLSGAFGLLSAWKRLCLQLAIVLLVASPVLIWLGAQTFPDNTSFSRRQWLNQQAVAIFWKHPLVGVGVGQFTTGLDARTLKEPVQFVQPAHHLGLLWLAETGLFGVLFVAVSSWQLRKNIWKLSPLIVVLAPLASFDHYLLTNQAGLLLVTIAVSYYWIMVTE